MDDRLEFRLISFWVNPFCYLYSYYNYIIFSETSSLKYDDSYGINGFVVGMFFTKIGYQILGCNSRGVWVLKSVRSPFDMVDSWYLREKAEEVPNC